MLTYTNNALPRIMLAKLKLGYGEVLIIVI
jgi:hypothetical protein